MGDRAQVAVKNGPGTVYLYTHWNGSSLRETLKAAMKRGRGRWNDPSYLTRIIFSEMIKDDDLLAETGFGISTMSAGDAQFTLVVDCDKQKVDGKTFEQYVA